MKKTKLFAVLLALTLAISCVLVACGRGEDDPPVPTKYTVTFNLNGATGTAPATQTIEDGKTATEPTAPTWTGYVFGGWYTDKDCTSANKWTFTTAVTSNITLYAKWTAEETNSATKYTVTFDLNGATGTAPATQTIEEGKTATAPADPTWTGYVFGGWYTDKDCTSAWTFTTAVTSNITLYAKWTAEEIDNPVTKFSVTFYAGTNGQFEDGSDTFTIEVAKDEEVDFDLVPAIEANEGYEFVNWYTDEECTTEWDYEAITSNLELYAGYIIQSECAITFDANNGTFPSNTTTEFTILNGEKISADLILEPTKFGYDFAGWYKDAEGNNKWEYDTDVVKKDMTLYAGWTKKNLAPAPEFKGINGKGISFNGTYKGIIDGEEAEIVCTPLKYDHDNLDENGNPTIITYGSIKWEGHVIEIVSIGAFTCIKIDGVKVNLSSVVTGHMHLDRDGYDTIKLKTDNAVEGMPMG